MSNESIFQTKAKEFHKAWKLLKDIHFKGDIIKGNIRIEYDVYGFTDLFKYTYDDCCLQKSQHIIAHIAGFKNWKELLDADSNSKKFARKLVKNIKTPQRLYEWNDYINDIESFENLDINEKFSIFKSFQMNYNNYPIFDCDMDPLYVD